MSPQLSERPDLPKAASAQPDPELLIKEVRRRTRRRRLMMLAAVLLFGGAVAALAGGIGGGGQRAGRRGTSQPLSTISGSARVSTRLLTHLGSYTSIEQVGGSLLLYGGNAPNLEHSSETGTCSALTVDAATLAVIARHTGSCANPALQGRKVIPALGVIPGSTFSGGGQLAAVRIAHAVNHSPGYALGPVVMTFPALAWGDSQPQWAYGDGDLWLYEWDNPGGVDLLRISATTGAVLQRLSIPRIWKPLLAVNNDGLWIGPSGSTGNSAPLYRISPGVATAVPVFRFPGDAGFARWLVASGDNIWFDSQPRPVTASSTLWMLRGPSGTPVWHKVAPSVIAQALEFGPTETQTGMVGNDPDGLWTVAVTPSATGQRIVQVNPRSGKTTAATTLRPNYSIGALFGGGTLSADGTLAPDLSILNDWDAVTLRGSLYLLDPPAVSGDNSTGAGFSALYRVTPLHR